jgi:hypothetical protein
MPQPEGLPGSQQNTIIGTGNIITGGRVINSRVTATTVNQQNPTMLQLREELTRVQRCLAAVEDPTADQQDALEAVDMLEGELAQDPDPRPDGLKRLRARIKGLIAVLAPVAEIIGGVAAFEEIVRRL